MNIEKVKKVKNGKIFARADIIAYIILALLIASFFLIFMSGKEGTTAVIQARTQTVKTVLLSEDAEYTVVLDRNGDFISIEDGNRHDEYANWNLTHSGSQKRKIVVIIIEGGYIWVEFANCRDRVCIHTGKQNKARSSILCRNLGVAIFVE